jgi:acetyl-CoA carboxylase biotin carboxyl carrier protein
VENSASDSRYYSTYRKIYISLYHFGFLPTDRALAIEYRLQKIQYLKFLYELIEMAEIQANMAGTIADVLVAENDSVSSGQDVVILESMKMHIPIQTTLAGTVKEVKVNKGDFVNTGHTLLVIE